LIKLDPNDFGVSKIFPYTVDFPMPAGVKPARDQRPAEPTAPKDVT